MKLKLGFSPCPNDTFIFDALVNKRIDNKHLQFEPIIADVEALNKMAFEGVAEVTKISMAAYPAISDKYVLLDSGSALGNNNGPLLVGKKEIPLYEIENLRIAIPGINTTANLLLSIAFPNATDKKEYLFSEIENVVLKELTDVGLLIHEGRFTYQKKKLVKIVDLGEFWESNFHQPIPLGGIAIKRDLPDETKLLVNQLINQSVNHAFKNPQDSVAFIKSHAQEMEEDIVKKHIALYVNEYSINLGPKGRKAIEFFYKKAHELGLVPKIEKGIFL